MCVYAFMCLLVSMMLLSSFWVLSFRMVVCYFFGWSSYSTFVPQFLGLWAFWLLCINSSPSYGFFLQSKYNIHSQSKGMGRISVFIIDVANSPITEKKCELLSRSQRVCHVQPRGWQWQQQSGSEPSWLNLSLLLAANFLKYAFKSSVVSSRIHLRADLQLHLQARSIGIGIGIGITSENFTFGSAKTIRKIQLWWTTTKENICKPGDCQQARQ